MAQGQTDMAWAKNQGIDNAVDRTSDNSTPTSFRQWSEEVLKPAVLKQIAAVASASAGSARTKRARHDVSGAVGPACRHR
jgi:hypothetical protein